MTLCGRVAITGAGSGIGAELACRYAARGCTLFLAGRDRARLTATAAACSELGATVDVAIVDVRDRRTVGDWIDRIDPVDLMIVNAGIFAGRASTDTFEPTVLAEDVIRTNLVGAVHCAGLMAPLMAARGAGHIALISSLAAVAPSPDAPAYSASKAGLTAYGEALREDLAGHGVRVSLVHPGHVETAQTGQQRGPLPLIVSAADAAGRIVKALDAGHGTAFPWTAAALVRLQRLLPWRLRARLNRPQRFTVRNRPLDDQSPSGDDG